MTTRRPMRSPVEEGLTEVAIRPYSTGDLWLLERLLGDPEMMRYLGGPESVDAIRARHERYLAFDPAKGGLFTITLGSAASAVGWIGYWEAEWQKEAVWECGWHVLPESQGRGVAASGTALMVERARRHGTHRYLHAFPSVDNAASNALCRRVGFQLLGAVEVEYPRASAMRSNDWRLDLSATRQRRQERDER